MRRATQREQEAFIAALLKAVPTATKANARQLLQQGAIIGKMAEAECNGDWPYYNPSRSEHPYEHKYWSDCPGCENRVETSSIQARGLKHDGFCPSCRAERIIREVCEGMGGRCDPGIGPTDLCTPHFQGDPRGYTVRLQIAGAPLDAYDRPALAVPTS